MTAILTAPSLQTYVMSRAVTEQISVIGQMLNSIWSINNLVFFNDQCDYVTSTFRGQLQAMTTGGQFDKTSKTNSVIYKCSYCFQTLKQWLHL